MKKIFLFIIIALLAVVIINAQSVGIGTNSPGSSAMLDVSSTTKGLLVPRMTSAQRSAIVSPANGLMVYDITTNSFWYYNNSAWTNLVAGGGNSFTLPYSNTVALTTTAFKIKNDEHYNAIEGESTYGTGVSGKSGQGPGVTGTSNSNSGIEGSSTSGSGVYANSVSGAGLNALSGSGFGIIATSGSSSSIYAFSSNAQPTINATNSNGAGVAIKGSSSAYNAIIGTSGGTNTAGVRGEGTGSGGNGVFGTSSSNQGYGVYGYNLTGTGTYGFSNTGTGVKAISNSGLALDVNGKLKIAGGNTSPSDGAVLTSDASGNAVWKNNKIAFSIKEVNSAYSGISDNSYTKLHFNSEEYDYGNTYFLHVGTNPTANASTFTVPKDGVYNLGGAVHIQINSDIYNIWFAQLRIKLKRAGVESTLRAYPLACFKDVHKSEATGCYSTDAKLLAGDIIWIEALQLNDGQIAGSVGGDFYAHLVFED
jgi:hypothetical protein